MVGITMSVEGGFVSMHCQASLNSRACRVVACPSIFV